MSRTVLIAEDDVSLMQLWARGFERVGFAVQTVPDGVMAIQVLQQGLPDILMVDYNMPGADGLTVLDALRELDAEGQVYTILVTANHKLEDSPAAESVDLLLIKPVMMQDIIELAENLNS